MKRFVLLIIPIILVVIIVFGIFRLFILSESGKGALQLTSHPLSKVYLNDKFVGNTPLCLCDTGTMINEGEYTVKLIPLDNGFDEFQEKITITKGVLTVVDRKFGKGATSEGSIISLTPLPDKHATELLVLSFPDKTSVFVDSNASGTTPLSIKSLNESDHTLKLKRDGYIDKNVRIRTPAGYRLTATVYLALSDETITATPTPSQPVISGTPTPTAFPSGKVTPTTKASGKVTILSTPNGFLRVRETPSTAGTEISRVNTGETYSLLGEQDGWYKITLTDGTIGWISATYASKQ